MQQPVIEINDKKVKLKIWDMTGKENFINLLINYFKEANGILFIYDVAERTTFKNLNSWFNEIQKYANNNICKMLIANCDLESQRKVSLKEGEKFANEKNMIYKEVSPKNNINITETFELMAKNMINIQEKAKEEIKFDQLMKYVSFQYTNDFIHIIYEFIFFILYKYCFFNLLVIINIYSKF